MIAASRIRTDWTLFGAIVAIATFGLVMVYSASSVVAEVLYHKETWELAAKQMVFVLIGLVLMMSFKKVDYRRWNHPMWVFLPLSFVIILLAGVIPADPAAHRWYRLWGAQIQPSEVAKPILVLFLAYFVARRQDDIN